MTVFHSRSETETENFAADYAKNVKGGDVIAFRGGLGMGKTAFTRGLARGLGNSSFVSSPTFAIVNDYGGTPHLYHFDMYRIESVDDLESVGFFDYMNNDSVLCIEWSENIGYALPENTVTVEFARTGENERTITVYEAKDR